MAEFDAFNLVSSGELSDTDVSFFLDDLRLFVDFNPDATDRDKESIRLLNDTVRGTIEDELGPDEVANRLNQSIALANEISNRQANANASINPDNHEVQDNDLTTLVRGGIPDDLRAQASSMSNRAFRVLIGCFVH